MLFLSVDTVLFVFLRLPRRISGACAFVHFVHGWCIWIKASSPPMGTPDPPSSWIVWRNRPTYKWDGRKGNQMYWGAESWQWAEHGYLVYWQLSALIIGCTHQRPLWAKKPTHCCFNLIAVSWLIIVITKTGWMRTSGDFKLSETEPISASEHLNVFT